METTRALTTMLAIQTKYTKLPAPTMTAWVGIGNKKADRITQSTVAAFLLCFRIVSPGMVGNAGPYAIYQQTIFITDFSRCPIQCDLVKMLESRGHEVMRHGIFNNRVVASGPGPIGLGGDSAISFVPLILFRARLLADSLS